MNTSRKSSDKEVVCFGRLIQVIQSSPGTNETFTQRTDGNNVCIRIVVQISLAEQAAPIHPRRRQFQGGRDFPYSFPIGSLLAPLRDASVRSCWGTPHRPQTVVMWSGHADLIYPTSRRCKSGRKHNRETIGSIYGPIQDVYGFIWVYTDLCECPLKSGFSVT